jgi:hypothetical protein
MRVILSHAEKDSDLARRIAAALRDAGLTVWDPAAEILPGDNWAAKAAQALQESEAMVVLLTPNGLQSDWVRRDMEYALGEIRFKHRLIPVLAGPVDELPHQDVPWILKHLNTVRLVEDDPASAKRVAEAILEAA